MTGPGTLWVPAPNYFLAGGRSFQYALKRMSDLDVRLAKCVQLHR